VNPATAPRGDAAWPSLATVIPVYNEEAGIRRSCEAIAAVVTRYHGTAAVIAVDDASTDASAAILADLAGRLEFLHVCTHQTNGGYGAALRTGAERAGALGFEYVAFIDSDLTNPPEDLLKIGELARSGHPYIKASRFISGGGMRSVPFTRRIFSEVGNYVGRVLFGIPVRDVTNGFRAVRTDLYLSWPLQERGFPVIVEELDWAIRSDVIPVAFPTTLTTRGGDQRPSSFPYGPRTILAYLRYPLRARMRRIRQALGGRG
jgi:dolichol-phosphate mannosyltransferase